MTEQPTTSGDQSGSEDLTNVEPVEYPQPDADTQDDGTDAPAENSTGEDGTASA